MNKDKPARTLAEILDEHIKENQKKQFENTKVDYNSLTLWEKETLFNLLYDKVKKENIDDWQNELKFLPDAEHIYQMSTIEQMMDLVKDLDVIELHTIDNYNKYVKVKTIDWCELLQYYFHLFKEGKILIEPQSIKEYIKEMVADYCIEPNQQEQKEKCIEMIDKLTFYIDKDQ